MIWIVQRGLDKYDGRKDTGSKQASKQASKQVKRKSALFPVELKTAQKTEGVFCPIYNGWDALFCVCPSN